MSLTKSNHPYNDILTKEYRKSTRRKQMPVADRSAQFSPFSALVGYEDAITETGRLTDEKIELSEEAKSILDGRLQLLMENLDTAPYVTILYFLPDEKKTGGKTCSISGKLLQIHPQKRILILENDIQIPIDNILDINSESLSFSE